MSLTLALNNALSGLNVNKQQLAVLSQNIANANTKGYTRKIVDQASIYLDGKGLGVKVEDVTRKVDVYLQRAIQLQTADVGKANVISDYSDRVQILLGKPGSANSIDAYVNNFFDAAQALAETPELTSYRVNMVNAGVTLARQTSELAASMEDLRFQADQDIKTGVAKANQTLTELYDLNQTIRTSTALGKPIGELLDKRDMLMNDLSSFVDISALYKSNGEVNIFTGNGVTLLDDELYQFTYTPAPSADTFVEDGTMSAIQVVRTDRDTGALTSNSLTLVTGGVREGVTTSLVSGELKGLLELRDRDLPEILDQLDMLASTLRDQFNEIHNSGSSYPGSHQLTGTRAINASDVLDWSGQVRIALLDSQGKPVPTLYSDETSGARPLLLDFSEMDDGSGAGRPSMQGIIDEINNHFGIPQTKATLSNLNNIQLVSNSQRLPGSPARLNFDFDLENISATDSEFWVTNVSVFDDTSTNITSVTSTIPSVNLDPVSTFTTTAGSNVVTVNTATAHGFANGQRIYLRDPGVAVDTIPGAEFEGFFTIKNVTSTTFEIETSSLAFAGGNTAVLGQTALPKYDTILAGEKDRTTANGTFTADITGNPLSTYYTINVDVAVHDGSGQIKTTTVQYRVNNNENYLLNQRYNATQVTGQGALVQPGTNQYGLRAMLVDADGVELAQVNGRYTTNEDGYLRIQVNDNYSSYVVAVDSLDSSENGKSYVNPPEAGTGRSFSHFFELNNFFKSNEPTSTGDTLKNSAINMGVENRLLRDPNLITLGQLTQSRRPVDPSKPPLYTYERNSGDNSIAQRLAKLGIDPVQFTAAGGLATTSTSFTSYSSQILSYAASNADAATGDQKNAQLLYNGFNERATAISGVNLDEELANTIVYQSAYTASARVITVTNELFDTLLNAVG